MPLNFYAFVAGLKLRWRELFSPLDLRDPYPLKQKIGLQTIVFAEAHILDFVYCQLYVF